MAGEQLVATIRWKVPEGWPFGDVPMAEEQLKSQAKAVRAFAGYIANCTLFEGWPVAIELSLADVDPAAEPEWVEVGDPAFVLPQEEP